MTRSMPMPDESAAVDLRCATAAQLAQQAVHCRSLGSPLYGYLLAAAADDCLAGGPTWQALQAAASPTLDDAVPLRFMAAVHRLVLEGRAPALATSYASVGGSWDGGDAWPAFRDAVRDHADEVSRLAQRPCQTNEVARSAALITGFLTLARHTRLPLRLLEIGASAGLNLRWDHFRYEHAGGDLTWGPHDSPVRLRGHWDVSPELLTAAVTVSERIGCDASPVDIGTDEGRLALMASLWGDQPERAERLRGALQIAARVPATVVAEPVGEWVPAHLTPAEDAVTVVYHSVVWQYLGDEDRRAFGETLQRAGADATPSSPVAWLRMEPEAAVRGMRVRLTTWPGGSERILASAGAHGFPVRQAAEQD